MPFNIPPEIFREILSWLHPTIDSQTLHACSLTNKARFLPAARRILFKTLLINQARLSELSFHWFLPRIATFVRRLVFQGISHPKSPTLALQLPFFPCCESVAFISVAFEAIQGRVLFQSKSFLRAFASKAKALECRNVLFGDVTEVVTMIRAFDKLERLEFGTHPRLTVDCCVVVRDNDRNTNDSSQIVLPPTFWFDAFYIGIPIHILDSSRLVNLGVGHGPYVYAPAPPITSIGTTQALLTRLGGVVRHLSFNAWKWYVEPDEAQDGSDPENGDTSGFGRSLSLASYTTLESVHLGNINTCAPDMISDSWGYHCSLSVHRLVRTIPPEAPLKQVQVDIVMFELYPEYAFGDWTDEQLCEKMMSQLEGLEWEDVASALVYAHKHFPLVRVCKVWVDLDKQLWTCLGQKGAWLLGKVVKLVTEHLCQVIEMGVAVIEPRLDRHAPEASLL